MHKIALFDLDNTIIDGDSDHILADLMIKYGLIEKAAMEARRAQMLRDYEAACLDVGAYYAFLVAPLASANLSTRKALLREHTQAACNKIFADALCAIKQHQKEGDIVAITTAAARILAEPIANNLGVEYLMATDIKGHIDNLGHELDGPANINQQKVVYYLSMIEKMGWQVERLTVYSDSHNDIPILAKACPGHAFAVNPSEQLRAHAKKMGWQTLSWR